MRGRPSITAEWVAYFRAVESTRSDAAVLDPFAHRFLGPLTRVPFRVERSVRGRLPKSSVHNYVVGRHAWMDDRLSKALDAGVNTVLILGAGYDSRAVRFQREGVEFWEVDHPATQARKAARIDSPARLVPVDFSKDDLVQRLVDEGFPMGERAFVTWEGVTMYLPADAIRETFEHLASLLGPRSELVLDAFRRPGGFDLLENLAMLGLPVIGEPLLGRFTPSEFEALTGAFERVEHLDHHAIRRAWCPGRRVYSRVYLNRYVLCPQEG